MEFCCLQEQQQHGIACIGRAVIFTHGGKHGANVRLKY
jgi:hypothetical protein